MSLVYIEIADGKIKKSGFEALNYACKFGEPVTAVAIGSASDEIFLEAGKFGADNIIYVEEAEFDNNFYASILAGLVKEKGAKNIIVSNTYSGKAIAPRLAVKLNAAIISGVVSLPVNKEFKKSVFSGKAFAHVNTSSEIKIITITPNSFSLENIEKDVVIERRTFNRDPAVASTKSLGKIKAGGKIPLTEAEVVVSAGRGMKGPENWGMIEELAELLGAATACSKPVSDMHWRPHTEHVGQTGITIKPNLYIAIGISGAIQHLAGVSSSKVIVAINKDAEAPFFKVADYGIVGDAFEVLPKLIQAMKSMKGV